MPPDARFSRRRFLATAMALPWSHAALAAAPATGGIVSLDYGLASTLLSLGVTPAAVAARVDWDTFVVEPKMPDGVADIGTSYEINLEIVARLKPSLILSNPFFAMVRPRLEPIAPVREFPVYVPDRQALPAAIAATRELGSLIGREARAAAFLEEAEALFEQCRARIARIKAPPVALLTLLDERHGRVYGGSGLYQGVLDRLGIRNAWQKDTSFWGFQTVALPDLVTLPADTRMMIFEPLMPTDILERLDDSPLWTHLPFVRNGQVTVLPGVLMFGMVREAMRFATVITDRMEAHA